MRSRILLRLFSRLFSGTGFALFLGIVIFFNLFVGFSLDILNDSLFPLADCNNEPAPEVVEGEEGAVKVDYKTECNSINAGANKDRDTLSFFTRVVAGAAIVVAGFMSSRSLVKSSFIVSGLISIVMGVLISSLGGFEWFIVSGCILLVLIILALRSTSRRD